jgi:hypothetical protein
LSFFVAVFNSFFSAAKVHALFASPHVGIAKVSEKGFFKVTFLHSIVKEN